MQILRLSDCEIVVCERQQLVFNAFIYFKPIKRM